MKGTKSVLIRVHPWLSPCCATSLPLRKIPAHPSRPQNFLKYFRPIDREFSLYRYNKKIRRPTRANMNDQNTAKPTSLTAGASDAFALRLLMPTSAAIIDLPARETPSAPRKSSSNWKSEMRAIYKDGKHVNHRLSRKIFEAKTDLFPYGEWTQIWEGEERLFGVTKADTLAFVGEHLTSLLPLDRVEVCLPNALTTLHVLAHLLKLIDDGTIDREMKTKEAKALLQQYNPQAVHKPPPLNVRPIVAKIARQLRRIKSEATADDGAWAMRKVQRLAERQARPGATPSPLNGPSPRRSGREDGASETGFGHAGGERAGARGEANQDAATELKNCDSRLPLRSQSRYRIGRVWGETNQEGTTTMN